MKKHRWGAILFILMGCVAVAQTGGDKKLADMAAAYGRAPHLRIEGSAELSVAEAGVSARKFRQQFTIAYERGGRFLAHSWGDDMESEQKRPLEAWTVVDGGLERAWRVPDDSRILYRFHAPHRLLENKTAVLPHKGLMFVLPWLEGDPDGFFQLVGVPRQGALLSGNVISLAQAPSTLEMTVDPSMHLLQHLTWGTDSADGKAVWNVTYRTAPKVSDRDFHAAPPADYRVAPLQ